MVARISCCHAKSRVHVDLEKIGDNNSATRSEEMRSKINLFFVQQMIKLCTTLSSCGPLSFEFELSGGLDFYNKWRHGSFLTGVV